MRPLDNPGPGQYSPTQVARDTATTFGFGTSQRKAFPVRPDQPGPGAYHTSGNIGTEAPKFTAVGRRELRGYPETPGPGAYMAEAGADGKVRPTPRWGFSTSPRGARGPLDSPGPGAYQHSTSMKGVGYSFRGRVELRGREEYPGPGNYGGYTQFG